MRCHTGKFVVLLLALLAANQFLVTPVIEAHKTGTTNWLLTLAGGSFGQWHGASSIIYMICSILALGLTYRLLELRGVSHRYGTVTALDRIDLAVRQGEALAVLGANGSGKSTLLRVLDGLLFPASGTYTAFGGPVTEDALEDEAVNAAFRSRIGFVFQNSQAQLFSTTVHEELAFGCFQLGLDARETRRRVHEVMETLEITDLTERVPHQLSDGQAKRVALGSVLVMRPTVLLLDEPTAALDPRSQKALLGTLTSLHEDGTTIVMASHDLAAVAALAERAVVMGEDHRIAANAPASRVLADLELLRRVNLLA